MRPPNIFLKGDVREWLLRQHTNATDSGMRSKSDNIASPAEVAQALRELADADLLRLQEYGRLRTLGMPWMNGADLFHEAIARALGGDRRWPRDVAFVAFLRESMRSIAHEEMRRRIEGPVLTQSELGTARSAEEPDPFENIGDERAGPEREVAARQALEVIYSTFAHDANALAVLAGMAQGLAPDEICKAAQISITEYQTAQKRIRRRLARTESGGEALQ